MRVRLRKGCAERCHMRKSLWPGPGSSRSGGDINVISYSPSRIALDSVRVSQHIDVHSYCSVVKRNKIVIVARPLTIFLSPVLYPSVAHYHEETLLCPPSRQHGSFVAAPARSLQNTHWCTPSPDILVLNIKAVASSSIQQPGAGCWRRVAGLTRLRRQGSRGGQRWSPTVD